MIPPAQGGRVISSHVYCLSVLRSERKTGDAKRNTTRQKSEKARGAREGKGGVGGGQRTGGRRWCARASSLTSEEERQREIQWNRGFTGCLRVLSFSALTAMDHARGSRN